MNHFDTSSLAPASREKIRSISALLHELRSPTSLEKIHELARALSGARSEDVALATIAYCSELLRGAKQLLELQLTLAQAEAERDAHGPVH